MCSAAIGVEWIVGGGKPAVNRPPWREVARQQTPWTSRPRHIEDAVDAERAVMAGLELVTAVTNLNAPTPLQSRVGIATGLAVVGELIASDASQEQAIVAETPNLAVRLQGIAEPNAVVITQRTRKLLGNLFELEDREAQDLTGIAGPV